MSCILSIETSGKSCSVAVSQDGAIIFSKEQLEGPSHSTVLGPMVDEALSFTDNHAIPFDAVAVSGGPGSYTGLRIGVSMAKGICYARSLPLIAVSTLELCCVPVLLQERIPEGALVCPMIDARRMEVYTALYDRALRPQEPVSAQVIDEQSFRDWLDRQPVYFFGDGAHKCQGVISHDNAHFIDGVLPLARHMFPLAEKAIAGGRYEDVAYYEPFYLKEFVATKSKKLL